MLLLTKEELKSYHDASKIVTFVEKRILKKLSKSYIIVKLEIIDIIQIIIEPEHIVFII